jgi:hypothetical protein
MTSPVLPLLCLAALVVVFPGCTDDGIPSELALSRPDNVAPGTRVPGAELLLERFVRGTASADIFDLPNGVDEFFLLFDRGAYHLYHHDFADRPKVLYCRTAKTIAGLASAPDVSTGVTGVYPSVKRFGATYHLYVFDGTRGHAVHYTSTAPVGAAWTCADEWPLAYASDPGVDLNPANNTYYTVSKTLDGGNIAVQSSSTPGGPWTLVGNVFPELPGGVSEIADPDLHFDLDGRCFLFFAAYDGQVQRICAMELSTTTYRPITQPTVLVEPSQAWQQKAVDGTRKIFNPVFVPGNATDARDRIYFAVNPGATGISCGWGYLEAGGLR